MENEVTLFENQYLPVMANYALLNQQIKDAQEKLDGMKNQLVEGMDQYDIKIIDNDYCKITRVEASESTSIDLKKVNSNEPELYEDLLKDYPKVTKRKATVKITVK
ncbi:hypothetical protein [uncultured Enterococcus sp.]|uniref:hypothetical protein n=1 Tax=uncultured Enterococcus sp. TaxID=167972 RepID=UPI00259512D9|nr:hypothetical protein [uncultured Enterococcus sp.]